MLFAPITLAIFILSISIHEFAHAWTADYLGDPTARLAGRKTLNPLAHIDLLGLAAMIFFGFGWAKPVPVNPYNLKNPRRDNLLVAFAGPASQIILSIILATIYHAVGFILTPTPAFLVLRELLSTFIQINLLLAFFNLLPLGPLDGFSVVLGLLPDKYVRQWEETKQYGLILLVMLMFLPNRFLSLWTIINWPVKLFLNILHI
jgi:Zn-dependent protease